MFKVVENRTFTHVVKVAMPIDGGFTEEELKVTYNYLSNDETKTYDLRSIVDSERFIARAVVRFDDLADAEGKPVPYSDGVRKAVLSMPNAWSAVVKGYFKAIEKAAEGN